MNLRTIRDKRKLTQETLSEMSGVDQSTISAIETGRLKSPSWQIVAKLARALEVAPDEIFPVEHDGTAA
jgi:transcriptional regulator with XRE-family HTH domain